MTEPEKPKGQRDKLVLPYGQLRQLAEDVIRNRLAIGVHFTHNDAWDALTTEEKAPLLMGHPTTVKAKRSFFQAITNLNEKHTTGLAGLTQVAQHTKGRSIMVYMPPARPVRNAEATGDVGQRLVFTLIGYTSDNKALYRDEESGRVGWVQWESL